MPQVDSILIDEARTPLIISGTADKPSDKYYKVRNGSEMIGWLLLVQAWAGTRAHRGCRARGQVGPQAHLPTPSTA